MDDHVIPRKVDTDSHRKNSDLSASQKISVGILTTLAVAIPVFVFFVLSPLKPINTPASGPITPTTPSVTITPTPPPTNNEPVITTTRLNNARLRRNYKTSVQGYDKDLTDNLEFSISGTADWLTLGDCKVTKRKIFWFRKQKVSVISCQLIGTPKTRGVEEVTLTLSDGHDEVIKTLNLRVR